MIYKITKDEKLFLFQVMIKYVNDSIQYNLFYKFYQNLDGR